VDQFRKSSIKLNRIKKASVVIAVIVGIQFVPTNFNLSGEITSTDFNLFFDVPPQIHTILKTSCYDCHSNNTRYPWYNKIQPVALLLERHIELGKEDLNFSEFRAYSTRKQNAKFKSIISQIEKDEMPLFSYTLIHRDAILSESDKEMIISWINELRINRIKK